MFDTHPREGGVGAELEEVAALKAKFAMFENRLNRLEQELNHFKSSLPSEISAVGVSSSKTNYYSHRTPKQIFEELFED